MQTGSETLFASTAPGQISHRREIGQRNCASVRIFTGPEIWSNGSSTRSSTVGVWQPATTSSRPTTSHSSSLRQYGCGCALMSPRPNWSGGDHVDPSHAIRVGPFGRDYLFYAPAGRRGGIDETVKEARGRWFGRGRRAASRLVSPPPLQGSLPAGWLAFTGRAKGNRCTACAAWPHERTGQA